MEELDRIREYFEDRADASCEPGDDRFRGNREMSLLQDVEAVTRAISEGRNEIEQKVRRDYEDARVNLQAQVNALTEERDELRDLARRLIRAEERMGRIGEDHPDYGETLSELAKLHSELQRQFPEEPK